MTGKDRVVAMKKSEKKKIKKKIQKYIDKALEKERERSRGNTVELFEVHKAEVCEEPIVREKPVAIGTTPNGRKPVKREKNFEIDDEKRRVLDLF